MAKKKYHEVLVSNLKKDFQIEQMKEQLTKYSFNELRGTLKDETIDTLKALEDSQKKDSTFVLTAIKDLYSNDLLRLKNKTYSGRKKEPITPEKLKVLRDLFTVRMNSIPNNRERQTNFGRCIKAAIENINRMK